MKNKFLSKVVLIISIFALTFCAGAHAADKGAQGKFMIVDIHGETIAQDSMFYDNQSERFFIPFRAFFEAMGAEVKWTANDEPIIIDFNGEEQWAATLQDGRMELAPLNVDEKKDYYSNYSGQAAILYQLYGIDILDAVLDDGVTYIVFDGATNKDWSQGISIGRDMVKFFEAFRCGVSCNYKDNVLTAERLPNDLYNEMNKTPCKLHIGDKTVDAFIGAYMYESNDEKTVYYPLKETMLALGAENYAETQFECTFTFDGRKYVCEKELGSYEPMNCGNWHYHAGKIMYGLKMYNGNMHDGHEAYNWVHVDDIMVDVGYAIIEGSELYVSGPLLLEHFGYRVEKTDDGYALIKDDTIDFDDTHGKYDCWEV